MNKPEIEGPTPIGTSCHNRFRGLLGKGRGRNGSHPKTRGTAGQSNSVWCLSDRPTTVQAPQQILETTTMPHTNKGITLTEPLLPVGLNNYPNLDASPSSPDTEGPILIHQDQGRTKNKRKTTLSIHIPSRPVTLFERLVQQHNSGEQASQVQINLNLEAFFQVQIHQDHGQKIANICDVTTDDVFQTLADDNEEKKKAELDGTNNLTEAELAEINSRFDPDPENDLGSEEE